MALLLGPPQSGKSTLLKALGGRLKHSGLQVRTVSLTAVACMSRAHGAMALLQAPLQALMRKLVE